MNRRGDYLASIQLGIRAHDLQAQSLSELVSKAKAARFSNLHFAPAKLNQIIDTDLMTPGLAHYLYAPIQRADLTISILGCYVNIIHPDRSLRETALQTFERYLDSARWFGDAVVATETGSVDISGYTPQNFTDEAFEEVVDSVTRLARYAESVGAIFAIEPGVNHPIFNIQRTSQLLNEVNSPNLKLIFDPVNLMTTENYQNQEQLIIQFLEAFQDKIILFHLKDFAFDSDQKRIVTFGQGQLNTKFLLTEIGRRFPHTFCTFEGLQEKDIEAATNEVKKWVNVD